ncbi:hypothetical protein [Sphingomonas aerolata]|uniref:hypothetical protein n=1 Tax=Sphingomonas aerolata TaxID=185951 RepID=UPI002FE3DF7E
MVKSLHTLTTAATLTIAIDLPSGLATDSGHALTTPPVFHLTLALGALKPAHLLQPAARYCGEVRLLDIGVPVTSQIEVLKSPQLAPPDPMRTNIPVAWSGSSPARWQAPPISPRSPRCARARAM